MTPLEGVALDEALRLGSATLHEAAGQKGALPYQIKPVAPLFRLAGTAFTVSCSPRDNLWLHRALARAEAGDVIVAVVSDHYEAGYWGEITSVAARARDLAGLVIDGCVRDADAITALGFPVFSRGLSIRGTRKDPDAVGALEEPIRIGDVTVHHGDLVVGDRDGVVVLPRDEAAAVVTRGREREAKERGIMERLRGGESTLDIHGWK